MSCTDADGSNKRLSNRHNTRDLHVAERRWQLREISQSCKSPNMSAIQIILNLSYPTGLHRSAAVVAAPTKQMLYMSYNLHFTPRFLLIRGPSRHQTSLSACSEDTRQQHQTFSRWWADHSYADKEVGGERRWGGGERKADRKGEARGAEKTWINNVLWANGKWLFHGDCLMSDSRLYQWIIYSHDGVNISLMKRRLVVGAVQPPEGTQLKVAGQSKSGGHERC